MIDDQTTAVDGMVARQAWTPADTAGRQYVWPVERDTDDQDWRWDGEAMYATRELAILTITRLENEQQAAVNRWFEGVHSEAYVPAHLRQRWRVGEPVLVVHP